MIKNASDRKNPYPPIEDYGIIGDLRTAALVGRAGSIDALCFPEFDSPSIFAAHVDREKGGRFQIEPQLEEYREKHLYLPDTNILVTRFLSEAGVAEITDYMVISDDDSESEQALVRRAKCVHGEISFRMLFAPKFDYARCEHEVKQECPHTLRFTPTDEGAPEILLRSDQELLIEASDGVTRFTLKEGESASFIMVAAGEAATKCNESAYPTESFKKTCNFWRDWISRCRYDGRWREAVHRSALALKLLTSRKHGSIISAPCFGFPNDIGGERNWDYRYTWLRDASFSTFALMRLGFTEEAEGFVRWLEDRINELKDGETLQTMYRIDGSKVEGEFHLDHLDGYKDSKPIRIGSTNHDQLQLDIYGEVMDSVYLSDKYGSPISAKLWSSLRKLIDYVCEHWQEADAEYGKSAADIRNFYSPE